MIAVGLVTARHGPRSAKIILITDQEGVLRINILHAYQSLWRQDFPHEIQLGISPNMLPM
jgi:hypothetical protein